MPLEDLRAEFPVLERVAYLNAGTDGPVPRSAADAAAKCARRELENGRAGPEHRASLDRMREDVRARLAGLLGRSLSELALTHSTTDGLNTVLSGMPLGRGAEVLTTTEEHPGLLAPLALAEARTGARIRAVPFEEIAGEVGPKTGLVACSHVSWVTGRVVDAAALAAAEAPVLLDGAQALGAVPVDVRALGCDFYAAAGQKWLCGPDGSGCLFVAPEWCGELAPSSPGYESLADPARALALPLHDGARRFDRGAGSGPLTASSLAALKVLQDAGWDAVLSRGPALASRLADGLAERGIEVAPRGVSTLVSWRDPSPAAAVKRLAAEGFVLRDIPGHGLMRASVGAWSSEDEVDALVAAAAG